jgi:predicted deacylase
VTVDLGGHEIFLPIHVIRGATHGPVVAMLACLHGDEWLSVEILRRVLDRVDHQVLRGALLAVPVANPAAFAVSKRIIPDDSDMPDLNRAFGSPWNWMSEQIGRKLADEIFTRSDVLLDFHTLGWGSAFGVVIIGNDSSDEAMNRRTDELARAFGYPMIHAGPRDLRTATGYASAMGVVGLAVEIGGAGFGLEYENRWVEENVACTLNLLRYLEMLPGDVQKPARYYYWGRRWRVSPSRGGYLHSLVEPDRLLGGVAAGELLGEVRSPFTLNVIEELRAPADGLLYCIARSYPVRPGSWAFGVAEMGTLRIVEA